MIEMSPNSVLVAEYVHWSLWLMRLVLATEPAFTHLEVSDCSQKVNPPEFPPVHIGEVEFAVDGLPNQEVGEAC